jgi:copper(I)-binding protein
MFYGADYTRHAGRAALSVRPGFETMRTLAGHTCCFLCLVADQFHIRSIMNRISILWGACLGAFVGLAFAGDVTVRDAWTRATVPGQTVAGVYFDIQSSAEAKLVGVQTDLTDAAEIHLMRMQDGVMRMRAVSAVDLPAGKTVNFKPGGYHVMLFDLPRQLQAGEQFPLELVVEDANRQRSEVAVTVQVRNLNGSKVHQHH